MILLFRSKGNSISLNSAVRQKLAFHLCSPFPSTKGLISLTAGRRDKCLWWCLLAYCQYLLYIFSPWWHPGISHLFLPLLSHELPPAQELFFPATHFLPLALLFQLCALFCLLYIFILASPMLLLCSCFSRGLGQSAGHVQVCIFCVFWTLSDASGKSAWSSHVINLCILV